MRFRLEGPDGIAAAVSSLGATLVSVLVPDRNGTLADIVLGFDTDAEYRAHQSLYFGSTIGRVANRIGKASFTIGGTTYALTANDGANHLHGGAHRSFDQVEWTTEESETGIRFRYVSPHLEEGYPGELETTVDYSLGAGNELRIDFEARSDSVTPVNLTNHAYWNLSGDPSKLVLDHELQVNAERCTPTDAALIPTGTIEAVAGTSLDFTSAKPVGSRIADLDSTPAQGYDHNFVLTGRGSGPLVAASLWDPVTGRRLEVLTDQPCMQVYSGNLITPTFGKSRLEYKRRSGICLEAQGFPDALHHDSFKPVLLQANETYRATIIYRFSTR